MNRDLFKKSFLILPASILFLLLNCTEIPFGGNIEVSENKIIEGKVTLTGENNFAGVYIWLEGANINTLTDKKGKFGLALPTSNLEGSGIFELFYYVANYKITTSTVVVNRGEFVPSSGDLDDKGNILGRKSLRKLLRIKTRVNPEIIKNDYKGFVQVSVSLQAIHEPVNVRIPKSTDGSSAIIFDREGQNKPIILSDSNHLNFTFATHQIEQTEEIFVYGFDMRPGILPAGSYQIIPYFLIDQNEAPPELTASFGFDLHRFGPDFLKIPFKREGGKFIVESSE